MRAVLWHHDQANQFTAMITAPGPQHSYVNQTPSLPAPNQGFSAQQQPYDTTGQVAPPGMKPRVTATLWEDEGSLCFQVEAKGVCVARREGVYQTPDFLGVTVVC